VLNGDPAPLFPESGTPGYSPPHFSAHGYCGKTAGWITVPLGTEVGFSSGDTALDGDPAPPKRGIAAQFSAHVCCVQAAGWIKIPLGTEGGRPRPRLHCVRWGIGSPRKRGTAAAHFSAHVYCGQTVVHLCNCWNLVNLSGGLVFLHERGG